MTIKKVIARNDYDGTGVLDEYDYDFKAYNVESFLIILTEKATGTELEYDSTGDLDGTVGIVGSGSDFEVDALKNPDGGTVFLVENGILENTHRLSILLTPEIIQDTAIANSGAGNRRRIELELDRSRQIDLYLNNLVRASMKLANSVDPNDFDTTFNPLALKFLQVNAANNGFNMVDLAILGNLILPATPGIAVYTGGNTLIRRDLAAIGSATIANADGQSGDPTVDLTATDEAIAQNSSDIQDVEDILNTVAAPFLATEQDVPDDTVKMTGGNIFNKAGTGPTVLVAAGGTDAITHGPVSGDSRYDILSYDPVGMAFAKTVGAESASPVHPDYPFGHMPLWAVLINETGTVTVNNADLTDLRSSVNQLNDGPSAFGTTLLHGRVNAGGSINLNEDGGTGVSFSVSKGSTGLYDMTLTGISSGNVSIIPVMNDSISSWHAIPITDKSSTTGFGTTTGFRVRITKQTSSTATLADIEFSFKVERIN